MANGESLQRGRWHGTRVRGVQISRANTAISKTRAKLRRRRRVDATGPPAIDERSDYSGTDSPEPPSSDGKSFSFGSPSFIGNTVSA